MGYNFISYSTKNRQMADSFRELFNRNGIDTWMAPGDIPFGATYTSTINRAIKGAACFTILLSKSAQMSPWVLNETERAVSTGKTIFRVMLDDEPMNDSHAIAVRKINENNDDIQKLLKEIKAYTGENNDNSKKQAAPSVDKTNAKPSVPLNKQVSEKKNSAALTKKSKPAISTENVSGNTGIADCKTGDTVQFGKYAQTGSGKDQTPIEWTVLANKNGKALLLSKYILEVKPFNNTEIMIEWQDSTLRKWMNGSFFNTALSDSEKVLVESAQKNMQINEDDRRDKFFLLSYNDMQNSSYGFVSKTGPDPTRRAKGTEYAIAQGLQADFGMFASWWILDKRNSYIPAGHVDENGALYGGSNKYHYYGIRPACWVNIYVAKGLCRYCGGSFKGFKKKQCRKCGKEKDY